MIRHSFAVMAYGDSPYLAECLDSLQSQTVKSIIYISTSTPSSFLTDIAEKYGVEIFTTLSGQGIAHDWNFSLRQASTKYVTLAHQDDLYLPDYTKYCQDAAEKFTDTLICFSGYSEISGHEERSNTLLLNVKRLMLRFLMPLKNNIKSAFSKKILLSAGCPIAAPSVMYNLEMLSHFQFSPEFSINMDWDAWYRMANRKGRFVFVKKKLLQHRIHPDSATSAGLEANLRQSEDLKMFNRFWPGFIAHAFAKLYSISYRSNSHKKRKP